MSALPEWPVEFIDNPSWSTSLHYANAYEHEKARADAAMARLRVAVEALGTIERHGFSGSSDCAASAIAAIGPLPEQP